MSSKRVVKKVAVEWRGLGATSLLPKLLDYLSEVASKYEGRSTTELIRLLNREKCEILKVNGRMDCFSTLSGQPSASFLEIFSMRRMLLAKK